MIHKEWLFSKPSLLLIRGYRLMVKLTAFQAVAMGSSPITRKVIHVKTIQPYYKRLYAVE